MKIKQEPLSAFAIYSEKLKQKKKKKNIVSNGISKLNSKKKIQNTDLNLHQVKEITDLITKGLTKRPTVQLLDNIINGGKKLSFESINYEEKISHADNKVEHSGKRTKLKTKFETKKKLKVKDNFENLHFNNSKSIKGSPFEEVLKNTDLLQTVTFTTLKPKNKKTSALISSPPSPKEDFVKVNAFKSTNQKSNDEYNLGELLSQNSIKNKSKGLKNNKLESKEKSKKKMKSQSHNDWTSQENSILAAKHLFEWIILPMREQDFMRNYWEKKPLLIQREGNRNYYSELLSTPIIDTMIRKNNIFFTKHLDITSYTEEGRETHNPSGRAQANVVWDFYSNGCSVRLLNPQQFVPKIHTLNATLQEYFGCFVGANVYLTPPNSQGFAPHYDDIEAFVLQIEGKKHWKVYEPRSDNETLPRISSPNFSQEEIGQPLLDVVLEPGDLLYFPRGFIHQASTVEGQHSLHITLSAYQKTSWVDLLEKTIPLALKRAAAEDVEFRRGLPRDYLGLEFHGTVSEKSTFVKTAQRLMGKLMEQYLPQSLGAGVDQMGAQFMHDALPPVFTPEETKKSVFGGGLKIKENGKLVDRVEFEMDTQVKLIRGGICRLVEEEDEVRLYHCLDNPLEYQAEEPQFLVLPKEGVGVIICLATSYPSYVAIKSLPHNDENDLLTLISDLWDAGLLVHSETAYHSRS